MGIVMPLNMPRLRTAAPDVADELDVQGGLQRANASDLGNERVPTGILLIGERERRLYILEPDKIDYIESHGNYVKFHCGSADYISRDSIKRLSDVLAARSFIRIERSLLVNLHAIAYAERTGRGRYAFTLISGSCLRSSASYRNAILRVLPLTQIQGSQPTVSR